MGRFTVTIATDVSGANWCCGAIAESAITGDMFVVCIHNAKQAAGSVELSCLHEDIGTGSDPVVADPAAWHKNGLGDL